MIRKPPPRCIFCRGFKLTREHVIPDWVQQIIPKSLQAKQRFTINTSLKSKAPPGKRPRHQWSRILQGHPISRKVRVVCETCNTGWLSDLEEEMKPQIKTLVLGEELTLTPWGQRRLATWAAKTAMTAEFLDPESVAITFDEREFLRLHMEPPKAFYIWAGRYDGSRHSADLEHHSNHLSFGTPTATETPVPPNTQTTIVCLGGLFLQVSSSSLGGIKFYLKDETVSNLRPIWPPINSDLSWPPITSLTDQDIHVILVGLGATFAETI